MKTTDSSSFLRYLLQEQTAPWERPSCIRDKQEQNKTGAVMKIVMFHLRDSLKEVLSFNNFGIDYFR